jgi:cardiolipin synthase C
VILFSLLTILVVALGLLFLRYWYQPPVPRAGESRAPSAAPPISALARQFGEARLERKGLTGIHVVDDGVEAFAVRRSLLRAAEFSIDAQYYMWRGDLTGSLLMGELLDAAERGVHVRLLLDDNTTAGTDAVLLAAESHPNIEVRLFNPYMLRKPRWPSYVFDLRRINRRMHNKSLTIDGAATVVGGRNIGDEYFDAHADLQFADMDVLAIGAVVADVTKSFEDYWNSKSAFPLRDVVSVTAGDHIKSLQDSLLRLTGDEKTRRYTRHVERTPLLESSERPDFTWVPVELVVDDPAKGQGAIARRKLLVAGLGKKLGAVETSIDVVTAYFVPGRFGSSYFGRMAQSGKKVRILTNSLASNDVVPVHAGYARYRKRLLRRGVQLFELRASSAPPRRGRRGKSSLPRFGASSSSLHAKIFVLDQKRVFIGSFNFDPRSLYLNCEMGFMIESAALGARIAGQMTALVESSSYTPFIEKNGRLSWRDTHQREYKVEPESTARQRVVAWVISWLPVEWLL